MKPKEHAAVVEACLEKPLYQVLAEGDAAHELAGHIEDTSITFDSYCVRCKQSATFRRAVARKPPISVMPGGHISYAKPSLAQTVKASCTRCGLPFTFIFDSYRGGIAKVGQNPSALDIATADLERFAGVLDDVDLRELRSAVLLHTHGAAVGAFVYLRRIFERLLDRHHGQYTEVNGPIEGFEKMAVEDRVLALKDVLPGEVVENRKMYRVLSKGMHKLDERECAILYDVMHAAIVEVLERDIYNQQQAKSSKDLRNAVAQAAGKLGLAAETDDNSTEGAK